MSELAIRRFLKRLLARLGARLGHGGWFGRLFRGRPAAQLQTAYESWVEAGKPSAPPGLKTAYESWVEAGKPPAPAGLKTATEALEPPTDERHTKA